MEYEYYICDVFTDRRFGGNQLAVLPNAESLDTETMQKIAREFRSYPKTSIPTFVGEIRSGKAALAAGRLGAFPCQGERGQSVFLQQPFGLSRFCDCAALYSRTHTKGIRFSNTPCSFAESFSAVGVEVLG